MDKLHRKYRKRQRKIKMNNRTVHIMTTSNQMTTSFYYKVIAKAFDQNGYQTVIHTNTEKEDISKECIIVVGGVASALRYYIKGYRNIVVWFQGAVPEERKMQGESAIKVVVMSCIEKFVLRKAMFCIFVSEAMVRHYEQKYSLSIDDQRKYIMPCFNENEFRKEALCKKNKYEKKIVFVYCGGTGVWQCLNETVSVCNAISNSRIGDRAEFRFYTNDVETVENILKNNGIENAVCCYIKQEELSDALADCDYGFVLRTNNVVNNVATPTKLSTYLSNGVIPIVSSSVRDFCKLTETWANVIQCDSLDEKEIVEKIIKHVERKINIESLENEFQSAFNEYYSDEYHVRYLGDKINDL